MSSVNSSGLNITIENGIQIIKFSNPVKKNPISVGAYREIKNSLVHAANNQKVLFTVFTGEGNFYSSGFDMTDPELFKNPEEAQVHLRALISTIIDYPKLIIALINGPAIGLAVTMLGLFDIVYASENATFQTPFAKLGVCAEGCSSYTFPKIFGKSKASEMLCAGHKMSAKEAYQFGFISEVYAPSEVHTIWEKIQGFKDLSQESILISKKMALDFDRSKLHEANNIEVENLVKLFHSEEFINNIMKFITRKSKL